MNDAVTLVATVALLVEGVFAVIAGIYIAYVNSQTKERAPYLTRLVRRDWRVAAGAVPIVGVVAYSFLRYAFPEQNWPPLTPPWGTVLVAIPIAVFMYGVIDDAIQFYRDRKIGAASPEQIIELRAERVAVALEKTADSTARALEKDTNTTAGRSADAQERTAVATEKIAEREL